MWGASGGRGSPWGVYQIPSTRALRAAAMSEVRESPTMAACARSAQPRRSSARSTMRGSGLETPSSWETTSAST